jgi:Fe-S cluster assembly iron-binding protein IscA
MQVYWLTDRTNGEVALVDADTVERLLGAELEYVEWCIGEDGMFENGKWKICE